MAAGSRFVESFGCIVWYPPGRYPPESAGCLGRERPQPVVLVRMNRRGSWDRSRWCPSSRTRWPCGRDCRVPRMVLMPLLPVLETGVVRILFRRVHGLRFCCVLLRCRVLFLLRCDGDQLRRLPRVHPCSVAGAFRRTRSWVRYNRDRSIIFERGTPRIRGAHCSSVDLSSWSGGL